MIGETLGPYPAISFPDHDLRGARQGWQGLRVRRPGGRSWRPGPRAEQADGARIREGHSVLLNSAIATDIMAMPMAATMPSDRPIGTGQPAQVTEGASTSRKAGAISR